MTKKSQGSKLGRSEILQFRLDPRQRFALELMARSDHRTVSSYIEKLVIEATQTQRMKIAKTLEEIEEEKGQLELQDISVSELPSKTVTITEALQVLWDVDEIHRFINMAFYVPSLLTYEEELMWRFIKAADYYWTHYQVQAQDIEGKPIGERLIRIFDPDGPVWDCLKEHWALLKRGEFEKITEIVKKTSKTMEDAKVIPRPADAPGTVTLIGFPAHRRESHIGVKSSKKNEKK